MFSIKRQNDKRIVRAFTHRLADVPNGVNVATDDLTQTFVAEGTPVGRDSNGLYHIVKTAVVAVAVDTSDTAITVRKGHNFKVGEYVFAKTGGKCYTIQSIATSGTDNALDVITLNTTLGIAISVGAVIVQGEKEGASAGTYKYEPIGLLGESYDVETLSNMPANVVTIGQITAAKITPLGIVADALKGIVLI